MLPQAKGARADRRLATTSEFQAPLIDDEKLGKCPRRTQHAEVTEPLGVHSPSSTNVCLPTTRLRRPRTDRIWIMLRSFSSASSSLSSFSSSIPLTSRPAPSPSRLFLQRRAALATPWHLLASPQYNRSRAYSTGKSYATIKMPVDKWHYISKRK